MARWIIATLAFLAIGWLDHAYGHGVALVTMLVLLVIVAVFGGHGPRQGQERGTEQDPGTGLQPGTAGDGAGPVPRSGDKG